MNRNQKMAIVLMAALVLTLGSVVLFAPIGMESYGDIVLANERTDIKMSRNTVLSVQNNDVIIAQLIDDPSTQQIPTERTWDVRLYRGLPTDSNPIWTETGGPHEDYPSTIGNDYRVWFYLKGCPEGTYIYFIRFTSGIGQNEIDWLEGDSHTFTIQNTAPPVFDEAEFVVTPEDAFYDYGSTNLIAWQFSYDGACEVTITENSVEVFSDDLPIQSGTRMITHYVNTSFSGDHDIVFTITPVNPENSVISDSVTVTISEPMPTPTTTPPTTTPPTTTSTGGREPPPVDYTLIGFGAIGAVLILVIVLIRRR